MKTILLILGLIVLLIVMAVVVVLIWMAFSLRKWDREMREKYKEVYGPDFDYAGQTPEQGDDPN